MIKTTIPSSFGMQSTQRNVGYEAQKRAIPRDPKKASITIDI
jgi:hypothetical protein